MQIIFSLCTVHGDVATDLSPWHSKQGCSLETLVLVSRHLEDMKNGLGLGLVKKSLIYISDSKEQ